MSKAGGTVDGQLWTTRVHSLRPGDYIKALNYAGDGLWMGGEPMMVIAEPIRLPKTDDRPAGYFDVMVQVPYIAAEWRWLCIPGDDQVQLAARDAVRETPLEVPATLNSAPVQRKRKTKPKKGQLKLFEDD